MNMEFDLSYADLSVFEMAKLHNMYSGINENVKIFISILRLWVGLEKKTMFTIYWRTMHLKIKIIYFKST